MMVLGNFVDSQYLGNAYDAGKPHVFEGTLARVYSAQTRFFTGKSLIGMTGAKSGGVKEIPEEIYRWTLQGAQEKSARLVENIEAGNATPGINGQVFRIKLDLDYYAKPDVLFGEDNEYPLAIQAGPFQEGSGYIYHVKIQGDDPTVFFPPELLSVGREFDKVWTSVQSEYNRWWGTQQAPNSFKLENQVGFFAQKLTVTDKAMRNEGRLGVEFLYTDPRTSKTRKISSFMPMYEARMHDELHMGMEAALTYGKKQTIESDSGYWIKTGPGLQEQLKSSWREFYNGPLTTTRIRDYLMSIFFAREDFENRQTTGMSATLGSLMLHDALAAEASSFLTVDNHFTTNTGIVNGTPHLAFGAQYTRYRGPNGITFDLVMNPIYDNRKFNKRVHPQFPDIPIESARITFLNLGSSGSENNIMMLKVKDSFTHGVKLGTHGPNGPVQGGTVSELVAGYDIFTSGSAGLWMKDPSKHGELIFDDQF